MNYYLQRFGAVYATATALPVLGANQRIGPDPISLVNVILPGYGTFDPRGTGQASPSGYTVTAEGLYKAANEAALQVLVDAMQAWIGKRTKLWLLCADTTVRWRYARLLSAPLVHLARGHGRFQQPMVLTFELDGMLWYGSTINSDTVTLDASPKGAEINNAGNQVVRDIVITVTAKGSDITVFDIANAETGHVSNIRFSGTIAQDKELIIDLGVPPTVKNDGVDAWNDLDRISAHAIDELLRLCSGNNTLALTRTGGDNTSTCKFDFYDGYAG